MRPCEGRGGGFNSPRTPCFMMLPCLADSSAGPPKAGWPVRLWHGVLWVVSRISSAGSTKPGGQVRLLHDLLGKRGARRERAGGTERAPSPVTPGRGACGEDQRQARLPVHQGAGRCD